MTTEVTNAEELFGCDVIDSAGNNIGSVDNVWVDDATNEAEFIGVKTGWLFGKTRVIPTADAQLSNVAITVPYGQDQIKDAPSFAADDDISPAEEDDIYSYYGIQRSTDDSASGLPAGGVGQQYQAGTSGTLQDADIVATDATQYRQGVVDEGDEADVTLNKEELQVGKRQVEAGRVRLRKIVRTERQEVPVDLKREEVMIERVPASEAGNASDAFEEGEIEVPVMREEPVIAKETRVTGGVRLAKGTATETRTVADDVRTEDVEVDGDVERDVATGDSRS